MHAFIHFWNFLLMILQKYGGGGLVELMTLINITEFYYHYTVLGSSTPSFEHMVDWTFLTMPLPNEERGKVPCYQWKSAQDK